MASRHVLVSHALCPYVQRAAITLAEKGVAFERREIDLANKPAWFLQISPLGKTPVLIVDGQPIFESAVICEYLDETVGPRLHPEVPLDRARHRGWMEFGSAVLNAIAGFYNAADEETLRIRAIEIRNKLEQIESQLDNGPYFSGARFSLVDAVFGPVFRYFDTFDEIADFGFFRNTPRVLAWRIALSARVSIMAAAHPEYPPRLRGFLLARNGALSARMTASNAF